MRGPRNVFLVFLTSALLIAATLIVGCGSGDSGPPGPEDVAKDYIEAGKVKALDKFLNQAMFGIPGILEIDNVETSLISETETTAEVYGECRIEMGEGGFRGNKVEMTLYLEKSGEEWVVTDVKL